MQQNRKQHVLGLFHPQAGIKVLHSQNKKNQGPRRGHLAGQVTSSGSLLQGRSMVSVVASSHQKQQQQQPQENE